MDNQTEKLDVIRDEVEVCRKSSQHERENTDEARCECTQCKSEQERDKTRQLIVQCFDLLSERKYDEYRSILNEHPKLHKKIRYVVLTEKSENDEIIQKTEKILKNAKLFAETLNEISLFLFKE